MLLAALPDPKRARNEAFWKKVSSETVASNFRSLSIKHKLRAAIAEAEDAIPLECGKEF